MKRLLRIYVRKRIWESKRNVIGPAPSDYEPVVEWVMEGFPFRWRTRLWVATHADHIRLKDLYDWLIG